MMVVFSAQVEAGTTDPIAQRIDVSVHRRDDLVSGYTVTEHYALFRGKDEAHQAADMTVRTTYRRETGKTYTILSENGSELMRKVLETILDNEKRMTAPANRATAVITSDNYEMTQVGRGVVNGRECLTVAIKPKRKAPYLFDGTIWVDAQDASIVQLDGTAVKPPSILAGSSHVFRQYSTIDGFPMASHAKAESNSWILGSTTIKIDYTDYQIQAQGGR